MFDQYAKYYDLINKAKDYFSEILFVNGWAERPKTILDIGCGTANYWKYYPKHVELTGIEKSGGMIYMSPYKDRIISGDVLSLDFPRRKKFDCVTALFDVINYLPSNHWWSQLPLKRGGFFIFDVWDKEQVDEHGFRITRRSFGNVRRTIIPAPRYGDTIDLRIILDTPEGSFSEDHRMYLYSSRQIKQFAGKDFEIVETRKTTTWQTWYKLRKK